MCSTRMSHNTTLVKDLRVLHPSSYIHLQTTHYIVHISLSKLTKIKLIQQKIKYISL